MNSSKTANLLMVAHNYISQNKKVILLKPSIDVRYNATKITSRVKGIEKEVDILITEDTDLIAEVDISDLYCLIVDEAQFLSDKHIEQLRMLTKIVPVICYGLRTDYTGHLFSGSKRLMELADTIEEIKTICTFCNRKAIINAKYVLKNDGVTREIVKEGSEIIEIGDEDRYMPLCWKCWL
jgi:thymidine kinase